MALTRTNVHSSQSSAEHGTGTWVTASFTPPNNSLLVVIVAALHNANATNIVSELTVSGGSLSYTSRLTIGNTNDYAQALHIWSAPVTTGASMTLTFDCGTRNIYRYAVSVVAYTEYDTSTPFGVSATDAVNDGNITSLTLSGAPASSSEVLAAVIGDTVTTIAPGSGWTEIHEVGAADTDLILQSQARAGSTSTSVAWTFTGSGSASAGGAIEVKQGAPDTTVQVVASASAALTNSRSPSLTFSSYTPVENDLVIMWPSATTTSHSMTEPIGWTNALSPGTDVESDAHQIACGWHKVTAGEASGGTTTYTATNWYGANASGDVVGCVVRYADPTTPIDSSNSTFSTANAATHVLASLTGTNLSTGSLVLSSVAKDTAGAYSAAPSGWSTVVASNNNHGRWLGSRNTKTTSGTDVTATNITPAGSDEYASITLAITQSTGLAVVVPALDASATVGNPTVTPGAVLVAADHLTATATVGNPSVGQLITAGALDASATVGNPTVTPGAVTATAQHLDASAAVGNPTVTPGAVAVVAAALDASATVGSPTVSQHVAVPALDASATVSGPTVTPGAVSVVAADLDASAAVGNPTVAIGATLVEVAHLSAAATVSNPTVSPGAVAVTVQHLDASATVHEPTVTAEAAPAVRPRVLIVTDAARAQAVRLRRRGPNMAFAVTVTGLATEEILVPHLDASATVHSPTVTPGGVSVVAAHLSAAATVGNPTVSLGGVTVQVPALDASATVGNPSVTVGGVTVAAAHLNAAATVDGPIVVLGGVIVVVPHLDASAAVGAPTVTTAQVLVEVAHLTATATVGSPAVSTVTAVQVPELTAAASVHAPAVAAGVVLVQVAHLLAVATVHSPSVEGGISRNVAWLVGEPFAKWSVTGPEGSTWAAGVVVPKWDVGPPIQ